jgi:outer membrane biosynthesis protein TonB
VKIFIDRQGKLIRYEFIKPSGNASFDGEIKRTLQSAVPLPEPPIAIIPEVSREGILLGFPI